jgi:hypothetical protein
MAGLVPAIHVFHVRQDVDARDKRGHDGSIYRVTTTVVPMLTRPNRSTMS